MPHETVWRYTASSQEVVRSDGVLIARDVPPEFGQMVEAVPELIKVLTAMVEAEIDYMAINNLGDGEQQHNVKWARRVIARARP